MTTSDGAECRRRIASTPSDGCRQLNTPDPMSDPGETDDKQARRTKLVKRTLTTLVMALSVFGGVNSTTHASGTIPNDNFLTTCATVHDTIEYGTASLYGCFQWNDTNSVDGMSGPTCSWKDNLGENRTYTVWRHDYTQIDGGHGYFACGFHIDNGGVIYTGLEYMDVFYNGTYTHHAGQ